MYVSFVISGDQLINVKYITIFLLYYLFLLFLSFSLDNEKERALDSVGGLNMANCGGLHNISLNQKKKKKKIKQEGKQENDLSGLK
jgi:hypothetical protein